ncbi:hypothetical protein [Myxacorys almedinensis]|uniref:Uncharacterized protein n=1 Tax=Myxacorys almedinensis A TaxID=2690445 RepID=A0A8J8CK31_9CYAN|nr:hypothetical protein [Myxacorys almedinensis]NDJ19174.1 hypothetical protein [Myxacorys almedinensis A]
MIRFKVSIRLLVPAIARCLALLLANRKQRCAIAGAEARQTIDSLTE